MPALTIDLALARRAALVEFTRQMMIRDQDFGEVPGSSKPALLKPGAEKLCSFFGLEPAFTPVIEDIDWTGVRHGGEPFCYSRYQCRLLKDGRTLGMGEGSCNSWESRYRFRWVPAEELPEGIERALLVKRGGQRTLCEFEFAIERAETAGSYGKPAEYWHTFREAIGQGRGRRIERDSRQGKLPAWEIDVDATLYRIPNPDAADLVNTVQKMGQKRAFVAATLIATSASEFFTQDIEESGNCLNGNPGDRIAQPRHTVFSPGESALGDSHQGAVSKPWKNFGQMRQYFEQVRERVGETRYFEELSLAGVENPAQFRSANKALECYTRLVRIAGESEAA
jgi:hypothetical protein